MCVRGGKDLYVNFARPPHQYSIQHSLDVFHTADCQDIPKRGVTRGEGEGATIVCVFVYVYVCIYI